MSDPPPPPPPPPPSSAPQWQPPGAHPLGPQWSVRTSTTGLRKAATVLFWCATAATALLVVATIYRRARFIDVRSRSAGLSDLDAADGFVAGAVLLQFALALATIIVLSIWSLRSARNAERVGAHVSPGWACGGWYIPFANLVVPFVQLRRILTHGRRSTSPASTWQMLVIVAFLVSGPFGRLGDIESARTADDLSSRLTVQIFLAVLTTLLLAATAVVATGAMKEVDAVARPQ